MNQSVVLPVSARGQITIPKKLRGTLRTNYVHCYLQDNNIVLQPLQTKDDFFRELEASEKSWDKKGGYSLAEVIKKSHEKV